MGGSVAISARCDDVGRGIRQLTVALEEALDERGRQIEREWDKSHTSDWITYEMLIRLPETQANTLLLRHWDHLRFSPYFVQAALFLATPQLRELARSTIRECPNPQKLFEHVCSRFGIGIQDRPGLTREVQVEALAPYLGMLSEMDVFDLWNACDDHGWLSLRREHLDAHLDLQPVVLTLLRRSSGEFRRDADIHP